MIKRYIASTIEKAQAKARHALGDNVVILGIRDLPSGDIELMAADGDSAREYYNQQDETMPRAEPRSRGHPAHQQTRRPAYAGARYEDQPGERFGDRPYDPQDELWEPDPHARPGTRRREDDISGLPDRHDDPHGHADLTDPFHDGEPAHEPERKRGPFSFLSRRKSAKAERPERVEPAPYFEEGDDGYDYAGYEETDEPDRRRPRDHAPDPYHEQGYPDETRYSDGAAGGLDDERQDHTRDDRGWRQADTGNQSSDSWRQFADGQRYDDDRPQDDRALNDGPPHWQERDHPYTKHFGKDDRYDDPAQSTTATRPLRRLNDHDPSRVGETIASVSRPSGGSGLHEPMEKSFSQNALHQLRDRLTGQPGAEAAEYEDPSTAALLATLRPHGISDRLLNAIRNGARKAQVGDDLYRLGIGLSECFNFSPLRSTAAIPLMLVGPTGAGKTSCAAKLAALALDDGDQAMLITTDVGRAGALEQFATYSQKLNIECYAAETPEEITTIMRESRPQGAVILDTPGITPYDAGDLAALKSYQTALGAEPILVLPASGDVGEYTDWAHAFRAFGVRACIITKFDATRRVGAGLSAAYEGGMTLTYFSESPFISEGLLPAGPEFLAYRLTAHYPGRIMQG